MLKRVMYGVLTLAFCGFSETMKAPVQGPQAPDSIPTYESDKRGKRLHIDFSLSPKPISDPMMKFSHFENRNLMIFYFSAKCSHCQHAFPHIQRLSDELSRKGLTTIAIAVKNNSEDDVRNFIREYKCHLPVFHDDQKRFSEAYGTGSIPLIVMVNEKGEYVRYKQFDESQTPAQIKSGMAPMAQR